MRKVIDFEILFMPSLNNYLNEIICQEFKGWLLNYYTPKTDKYFIEPKLGESIIYEYKNNTYNFKIITVGNFNKHSMQLKVLLTDVKTNNKSVNKVLSLE